MKDTIRMRDEINGADVPVRGSTSVIDPVTYFVTESQRLWPRRPEEARPSRTSRTSQGVADEGNAADAPFISSRPITRVIGLTRDKLEDVAHTLVSMDEQCMEEMGEAFCTVPWDYNNYRMDLKGKWNLSRIAENDNGDIAGAWIASNTVDDICHTHRVIVRSGYRRQGIAEAMFHSLRDVSLERGLSSMTIEVSCINKSAIVFYRKMRYSPMNDAEIRLYLEKRERRALVLNGRLEESDGSQYFVLKRAIQ